MCADLSADMKSNRGQDLAPIPYNRRPAPMLFLEISGERGVVR
jgi:hypothetical protein